MTIDGTAHEFRDPVTCDPKPDGQLLIDVGGLSNSEAIDADAEGFFAVVEDGESPSLQTVAVFVGGRSWTMSANSAGVYPMVVTKESREYHFSGHAIDVLGNIPASNGDMELVTAQIEIAVTCP